MQRMSRMKASVTVARTQPLTLVPQQSSVSMRCAPGKRPRGGTENCARPPFADQPIARLRRKLGNDLRAAAAFDLDAALGMEFLLEAP